MKILLVGASGTIGSAIKNLFTSEGYDVIPASYNSKSSVQVNIQEINSIKNMFAKIGHVDGIVSAVGGDGFLKPFDDLTAEDFSSGLSSKALGQVNLVTVGRNYLNKNGCIILTSGYSIEVMNMPGASLISTANASVNNFVKAVSSEVNSFRINTVIPNLVTESALRYNISTEGSISAADTAKTYLSILRGNESGKLVNSVEIK